MFPAARVVVFVDGCFWHGCPLHFQQPETNAGFWKDKIRKNILRDRKVVRRLTDEGWTVLRFWEHDIKERLDVCIDEVVMALKDKRGRDG